MRGTLREFTVIADRCRIIPAHAGNTHLIIYQILACSDHPRACGEHRPNPPDIPKFIGSSPRMRGTRNMQIENLYLIRIIPAHAGNTFPGIKRERPTTDHPRACGEHSPASPCIRSAPGSSPRMRGTLEAFQLGPERPRIIPAHAGNTRGLGYSCGHSPDHPRACGEHKGAMNFGMAVHGSSPRMRGTQGHHADDAVHRRIIPAHAGNTRGGRRIDEAGTDHPRACGEHGSMMPSTSSCNGSSPRMRGTPTRLRSLGAKGRIIPAHAGNTPPDGWSGKR